jgi:hypothetical protein
MCTCRACSESKCHPFRNDVSHINLLDVWLSNCLTYFGQPENDDQIVHTVQDSDALPTAVSRSVFQHSSLIAESGFQAAANVMGGST